MQEHRHLTNSYITEENVKRTLLQLLREGQNFMSPQAPLPPPVAGWWWSLSRAGLMQVITIKDALFLMWVTSSLEIFYYHAWNLPFFHMVHYLFVYLLTYFSIFQGIDDHQASVSEEVDMLIVKGAWETHSWWALLFPFFFPLISYHAFPST